MDNAIQIIFEIIIVIFSIVIHEVSHGFVALALGDRTAKNAGRLTLNPVPHIDPLGSLLVPILSGGRFGWARPVPFNLNNLRNQRWGPAMVGAAGPLANLSLAIVFGLVVRLLPAALQSGVAPGFLFNFLTISALIVIINLSLAIFNFIPIPPLDGSKVLFAFLPYQWRNVEYFLEEYGFYVLIFFVFFLAPAILSPVVLFLFRLITGSFPF